MSKAMKRKKKQKKVWMGWNNRDFSIAKIERYFKEHEICSQDKWYPDDKKLRITVTVEEI